LQALQLAAVTEPDLCSEYGGTDHQSAERGQDPAVTDVEQAPTRENIPILRVDNRQSEGDSTTNKPNENAQRTLKCCSEGADHPPNAFRAIGGHDSCKSNKGGRSTHSRAQTSTPSVSDGFETGVEPSPVVTPQNGGSVEVGIQWLFEGRHGSKIGVTNKGGCGSVSGNELGWKGPCYPKHALETTSPPSQRYHKT
jgi:hypothetical protein